MQPRLRAAATATATADGVLFRMGESFLSVRGRMTRELLGRLSPLLDGRHTLEEVIGGAREARDVLVDLIQALRDAAMVYDAADDDACCAVDESYRPLITRIEAHTSRPFRTFAAFRTTRVLVLGRSGMVPAVLRPLLDTGLRRLAVAAPDWDADAEVALKRPTASAPPVAVERLAWSAAPGGSAGSFDVLVVIGDADTDRKWMEAVDDARRRSEQAVMPLVIHRGRVLAAAVLTSDGSRSLRDLLERFQPEPTLTAASRLAVAVDIGGRVLAQRLVDYRTGILQRDELETFHDVDGATLEIHARPMPLPHRPLNAMSAHAAEHEQWRNSSLNDQQASGAGADRERILGTVYRTLVDPITGLILRLEEHELQQLPHHQSVAFWRPASCELVVTTGAGANLVESRFAVARCVLEEYLGEMVRRGGADPRGIVVAGRASAALEGEAWFRALAGHAHRTADWTDVPLNDDALESEASLTLEYLRDDGAADSIRVERYTRAPNGDCDVLRFNYAGAPVSVVAGRRRSCWTAGLWDVWLTVSARAAYGDKYPFAPRIQYRCATSLTSESGHREALSDVTAGARFVCRSVAWPDPGLFDSLSFLFAYFDD